MKNLIRQYIAEVKGSTCFKMERFANVFDILPDNYEEQIGFYKEIDGKDLKLLYILKQIVMQKNYLSDDVLIAELKQNKFVNYFYLKLIKEFKKDFPKKSFVQSIKNNDIYTVARMLQYHRLCGYTQSVLLENDERYQNLPLTD